MQWLAKLNRALGLVSGLVLAVLVVSSVACDKSGSTKPDDEKSKKEESMELPESLDGPMIPRKGEEFDPALVRVAEEEPNLETLARIDKCAECHQPQVEQWRDSMHRFASFNNPMYRLAFDKFVEDNGEEMGPFCSGCHDPIPLLKGRSSTKVVPDSKGAHAGITCNTCHGVKEATKDGNGSFTLTTSEVPIPKEGDDESLQKHLDRVGMDALRSDALCISCHRGFLSPATGHQVFILGFDEFGPWRRSVWNDNQVTRIDEKIESQSCVDCHMPEDSETGFHSHRFAGGHTTMAEMIDSDEQLEEVRTMIENAATIDVAAAGVGKKRFPSDREKFSVEPGERFWFDVVVRNVDGGHNFPGGQRDLRDTWIEATLHDADGNLLAEAGVDHRESGDDKSAHRLRALLLTVEAQKEQTHTVAHFRTKAYDHTIEPRNAGLARYAWTIPESLSEDDFPLEIRARLQHRRLSKGFQKDTCEATKSGRGKAFLDATEKHLDVRPDPCLQQPITKLVEDTAEVYTDRFEPGDNKPEWKRWFARGLAMQGHLSERLDEAHDSFKQAAEALESSDLDKSAKDYRKAMILVGRAQVMARQRRHLEALDLFDEAEALVPGHPAIFVGRGDAYANVWQFDKAVAEYEKAAEKVDGDRVWRKLAIGRGSMGKYAEAIRAAQKGLPIEPRDADLLRSQMIALRNLDVPEKWAEMAADAYDTFKKDEEAHLIRAECSDRSEVCRLERLPIHTHQMESAEN